MSKVESSQKNVAKLKLRQHMEHKVDAQMIKWIMDYDQMHVGLNIFYWSIQKG